MWQVLAPIFCLLPYCFDAKKQKATQFRVEFKVDEKKWPSRLGAALTLRRALWFGDVKMRSHQPLLYRTPSL